MFRVIVHKRAVRYLQKLPKQKRERIKAEIKKLGKWPSTTLNVKPMLGDWKGYCRIRIGKLRVIFWLDTAKEKIYVDYVGTRGDIY